MRRSSVSVSPPTWWTASSRPSTSSLQTYPLGMQPTSLKVTDDAIEITLEGGAYTMPAAGTQQQQQEQQSSCGLLV